MARAVRKTPAEAGGDAQGVMRLGEQRDISGVHHPFRPHPSQCWLNLLNLLLCYRPHAFGRCHYYQAWPYTYVHVLRVHVRRSRSHKYRPITSSKPLFSFSCVQRALLHDFIKICLLKLLGGFFKVKS